MASIVRPSLLRQFAAPTTTRALQPASAIPSVCRRTLTRSLQRPTIPRSAAVAAFHTTAKRDLLPPGPQVIQGTVNDPVPVPPPHPSEGSYHWTFDRIVGVALVPLCLTPFAAGSLNPTMDAVLCGAILLHSHMGFQNIIIDYIPQKRMPGMRKLFVWALRAGTVLVGVGLYEFETNDVGLTEAITRIWKA